MKQTRRAPQRGVRGQIDDAAAQRERRNNGAIALVISHVPRTLTAITCPRSRCRSPRRSCRRCPWRSRRCSPDRRYGRIGPRPSPRTPRSNPGRRDRPERRQPSRRPAAARLGRASPHSACTSATDDRFSGCRGTGLGKGATQAAPGTGDQDRAALQAHVASRARAGR